MPLAVVLHSLTGNSHEARDVLQQETRKEQSSVHENQRGIALDYQFFQWE